MYLYPDKLQFDMEDYLIREIDRISELLVQIARRLGLLSDLTRPRKEKHLTIFFKMLFNERGINSIYFSIHNKMIAYLHT